MWLSLVERYVRDVEVAGSNPVTPIKKMGTVRCPFFLSKVREQIKRPIRPERREGVEGLRGLPMGVYKGVMSRKLRKSEKWHAIYVKNLVIMTLGL